MIVVTFFVPEFTKYIQAAMTQIQWIRIWQRLIWSSGLVRLQMEWNIFQVGILFTGILP